MTEPKKYVIRTISDMFAVPIEKRSIMFREIELGMSVAELSLGDQAPEAMKSMTWVDDGERHVTMNVNGENMLELIVTKEQA